MTPRIQQPIDSVFDKSSTAIEVIDGLRLTGKNAVITGGHSGLGLESTKALASAGVNVIIGARNVIAAREALESAGVTNATVFRLDLEDLESVKAFAANVNSLNKYIDILMCNSGIMACPERRIGSSQWESQFATNHIGHFVLTNLIWDKLNNGARVVCVSSAGHHNSDIRWNDIHFEQTPYDKWEAYGQSKTANCLFALQLDEYGKERNIRTFSLHPGKILTPLQRHLESAEMVAAGWIDESGRLADPTFKTPEQGAATQVWAATSPMLDGMGGLYCEDCNITKFSDEYSDEFKGIKPYAADLEAAKKLWEYTADLTHVNAFSYDKIAAGYTKPTVASIRSVKDET